VVRSFATNAGRGEIKYCVAGKHVVGTRAVCLASSLA